MLVHSLSPVVFPLHVQSDPAHSWVCLGLDEDMVVHGSKHPKTSPIRYDIDALDPSKDPVPPVAPFVRNHELADRLVTLTFRKFRNDIKSIFRVF